MSRHILFISQFSWYYFLILQHSSMHSIVAHQLREYKFYLLVFVSKACLVLSPTIPFKGGPEPLEKEIHEILGSKREDRFSDPFFD